MKSNFRAMGRSILDNCVEVAVVPEGPWGYAGASARAELIAKQLDALHVLVRELKRRRLVFRDRDTYEDLLNAWADAEAVCDVD